MGAWRDVDYNCEPHAFHLSNIDQLATTTSKIIQQLSDLVGLRPFWRWIHSTTQKPYVASSTVNLIDHHPPVTGLQRLPENSCCAFQKATI
eukprot:c15932_g2_i1 orf=366-638(-)